MRHKNLLPLVDPKTKKPDWKRRLRVILKYGMNWYREYKAQEVLARALARRLDGRFTLIRNASVPGWEYPWPPVLVGPTGVYLIYATPKKGLFRVREDLWEEMSTRARSFRPARPNLVRQTLGMARVLADYLTDQVGEPVEVQPAIVFTDPGAMVNALRPVVRVVMADALDAWIDQITTASLGMLPVETLEKIIAALAPSPEQRKAQARQKRAAAQQARARRRPRRRSALERYFNFTPKQWLILGALAGITILMLVAFILLIVVLSTP